VPPASAMGIDVTLLFAPTSSTQRMKRSLVFLKDLFIWERVTGVTVKCDRALQSRVSDLLKQIRGVTDESKLGVGFGISQPEEAQRLCALSGADAAIVGSAFVKHLAEGNSKQRLKAIALVLSNPQAKHPDF
jgi:tryptophan synthase alpha chain